SQTFAGPVHAPGSDDYDRERAAIKGFRPDPMLVAEATGADDIRAALAWANRHDVPVAVQSTGHGTVIGSDGGLLVKTHRLATLLVDPDRRVATAGAGVRWGSVLDAGTPFGLAPLCGTSAEVGVAGYTLGGGFGWLARRFGLAADSLLRAELVTADGKQLTVTPEAHPDLFWAIRGGGGNFGVVTSLEFRLYPVSTVVAGSMTYPFQRAADVLAAYRDWTQPDELSVTVVLTRSPDGPRLAVHAVYTGDPDAAAGALAPLRAAAGEPESESFARLSFPEIDLPSLYPANFEIFREVSDSLVATLTDLVTDRVAVPADEVELHRWAGAMAEVGPGTGPAGHRDVPFAVTVDGAPESADPIRPYATGGTFLNFCKDPARTPTAFTAANYERLRQVKRTYDPDNVFHRNFNIPPAETPGSDAATGLSR
ncbi:FAD-binding oxidoreductase, partial [Actinophytocola sp.]|uniref:FAD-binding oxidoreductase n=1 Tax=Actinophytocola sp. TaxID=1872138 RepID=UPI002D8040DA